MLKLLIDTDIGDDIDDALAIGMALKAKVDIVAITTVYREARKRSCIVNRLLEAANRKDIKVAAGYSNPISNNLEFIGKLTHGNADGASAADEDCEEAVDLILECARKYGKELTLLVIGAQTNIARAILKDKEAMLGVGRVVIMGGAFVLQHSEYNIFCDPTAAKIVCESGLDILYVPWDITKDLEISAGDYERIISASSDRLIETIAKMCKDWKAVTPHYPTLHDPLALLCALDEKCYRSRNVDILVLDEGILSGTFVEVMELDRSVSSRIKGYTVKTVCAVDNEEIIARCLDILL